MPKNSASEVNVAASSTTARTMSPTPHEQERVVNIVHVMFTRQAVMGGRHRAEAQVRPSV
jgi:hypothetical protein